jgi:hypothetical protein
MRYFTLFALACGIAAACGNPLALQAFRSNIPDTVSVYALSGTPISAPSAFSIVDGVAVRTDQGRQFDFAFDIDTAGRPVLLPTGALHLGKQSGLQISALQFDSIKIAPTGGYELDSAIVVHENSVVIAHSSPNVCTGIIGVTAPFYAKLHVLTIDTTSGLNGNGRRIDFEVLADRNCGFRGLEPGLPRH